MLTSQIYLKMVDNTYYTLNEGLLQRTAATHFWLTAVTFTEDKPTLPEPLRLFGVEVRDDAGDVEGDDGAAAGIGEKEGAVLAVVHKEVFREHRRTIRVLEDVERLLQIRITIGKVRPELTPRQILLRCPIQAIRQAVGLGMPRKGIGTPPSRSVPLPVGTGSIDVDADEDGVGGRMTEPTGLLVSATDALFQGNVLEFGDKELRIIAPVLQVRYDGVGNFTVVLIFAEMAVGRALARGVTAVAVVD